jgi:MFS transporter, OFA family, oxalate/formate antiporter
MDHRWRIAGAAVLTHVCLGSVYAWSIFVPALQAQAGWSKSQLTWAFSLAIACLGLTAALAAPWMVRLGPQRAVTLSAAAFAAGLLGASAAVHLHSLWLLYASYGVLGGIGLGLGYVPPVTTLMHWFADRKGFATGLAVGGFGLGALFASFLGEWLLQRLSCAQTFLVLGSVYGPLLLLASRSLHLPPGRFSRLESQGASIFAEFRFWALWVIFFLNIATGILLIALARPMLEESGRLFVPAVTAVAVMGLCNGLGRLGWSSLSDHLGRTRTWMAMFLLQALVFLLLRNSSSAMILVLGLWLLASCYGGGFAICPALVAETFGPARAPRIYGLTLTAWSAAALISPPLAARFREATGSYSSVLWCCFLASGAGLALAAVLQASLAQEVAPEEAPTS